MVAAKILGKTVTIADGSVLPLVANRLSLPKNSKFVGADVSKTDVDSPPVFSVMSFGIERNAIFLDAGWTRGGPSYQAADGLHWDGELVVPDEDGWSLFVGCRNVTGSAQTISIEALIIERGGA